MKKIEETAVLLSERVKKAASLAYAFGLRDADICAEMNIAPSTLGEWKRRPEWRATIEAQATEAWGASLFRLKACTVQAVVALEDMLHSDDAKIRLRAAALILEKGLPVSM